MKLFKITETTLNGSHPMNISKTFAWTDDEKGLRQHIADCEKTNNKVFSGGPMQGWWQFPLNL